MIIHCNHSEWYITAHGKKSTSFKSYEDLRRAILIYNLPDFSKLHCIKSSSKHSKYVIS